MTGLLYFQKRKIILSFNHPVQVIVSLRSRRRPENLNLKMLILFLVLALAAFLVGREAGILCAVMQPAFRAANGWGGKLPLHLVPAFGTNGERGIGKLLNLLESHLAGFAGLLWVNGNIFVNRHNRVPFKSWERVYHDFQSLESTAFY